MKIPNNIHDSKFIAYFKLLQASEYKGFRAFVAAHLPKSNVAFRLLAYCCEQHPAFDSMLFTKERILRATKISSNKKLEQSMYELLALIENFITHQELDQQPLEKDKLLANALAKRGNYSLFKNHIQRATQKIRDQDVPSDTTHFLALSTLNEMLYFHPSTNKLKSKTVELDKAMEYLEKFYLLSKLRYVSESMHRNTSQTNHSATSSEYISQVTGEHIEPVFQLYTALIRLLRTPQHATFLEIKDDFQKNMQALSAYDKSRLVQILFYYAGRIYEEGDIQYLFHMFELLKIAEENNFITYQNALSHVLFVNIVSIAAGVHEFDWARRFITKYEPYLNPKSRKETLQLADAYCYFFNHQYEQTLQELKDMDYWDISIRLQAETLCLRVYYKWIIENEILDCEEPFDSHADNLLRYMDREKSMVLRKKKAIKNFINMLKKFIKYARNPNRKIEDINKLEAKLLSTHPIIAKAWLLEELKILRLVME